MRLLARLISSAICIATSVSCFAAAMERPIVSREHSVVLDGEQPLYVVTEINEMTDSRHENVVLIEDVVHSERYIARSLFDLTAEESVMEITDLSRRLYLRRSYVLLKTEARTLAELRAEMDRHMKLSELADVPVKLETPSFTHVVREGEFTKRDRPRRWVSDLPGGLEGKAEFRISNEEFRIQKASADDVGPLSSF